MVDHARALLLLIAGVFKLGRDIDVSVHRDHRGPLASLGAFRFKKDSDSHPFF